MKSIWEIFQNHAVICALISWLLAQALKIPIYRVVEKKWDWHRFFGSGGMPSSHSALTVSLCCMVGVLDGFGTTQFAISLALAVIVMYDAAGVRRESGTQAAMINQILRDVLINGKKISDDELKELIGHTPLEVCAGALLGLVVAVVYILILL